MSVLATTPPFGGSGGRRLGRPVRLGIKFRCCQLGSTSATGQRRINDQPPEGAAAVEKKILPPAIVITNGRAILDTGGLK